jgi:hypothetical protein
MDSRNLWSNGPMSKKYIWADPFMNTIEVRFYPYFNRWRYITIEWKSF